MTHILGDIRILCQHFSCILVTLQRLRLAKDKKLGKVITKQWGILFNIWGKNMSTSYFTTSFRLVSAWFSKIKSEYHERWNNWFMNDENLSLAMEILADRIPFLFFVSFLHYLFQYVISPIKRKY
ncbi:hypothetical protein BpHYR1_023102 [Brachionus plicatilis]|uniref:Uncharacterized protein n=1 Tax=Brachionus plicatilis TaxID=10195 RepID=A0A3M7T2T7_BRAPC|nr:hypothetical protein BpHYR1_023102 [Brachionus plicatilis]